MKTRLDNLLVDRGLASDIKKARAMIGAGEVLVHDTIADKPGLLFEQNVTLRLKTRSEYVSRGGYKLARGLEYFKVDVTGMCCIDIGASSGGFTDCLLKNGASKVFAVDVAYGQLDWKLRQDGRVVVLERFNARKIRQEDLDEKVNLAVMDASFISITKILPALLPLFSDSIQILSLIKPQFELPKASIPKGGVVTDPTLHQQAIDTIIQFSESIGLQVAGVVDSPILGPKGNKEFLVLLRG